LKYEPGTIVAEGDLVIVHGRFSHFACPSIGLQRTFFESDRILVEDWDVIQDEATEGNGAPTIRMPRELQGTLRSVRL
jgi:predicted SnoaL-like aldol condensation-catalyzing enzyme